MVMAVTSFPMDVENSKKLSSIGPSLLKWCILVHFRTILGFLVDWLSRWVGVGGQNTDDGWLCPLSHPSPFLPRAPCTLTTIFSTLAVT